AIDHHRELVVPARDPAVRAQFAQREREITGRVRRDGEGLPHHCDTAGTTRGRHGVFVRQLRVAVDQPRNHHEVVRNALGVLLAQGLELCPGHSIEFSGFDVLWNDRLVVPGSHRAGAVRIRIRRKLTLSRATVSPRGSPVTGPESLLVAISTPAAGSPTIRSSTAGAPAARSTTVWAPVVGKSATGSLSARLATWPP